MYSYKVFVKGISPHEMYYCTFAYTLGFPFRYENGVLSICSYQFNPLAPTAPSKGAYRMMNFSTTVPLAAYVPLLPEGTRHAPCTPGGLTFRNWMDYR